MLIGKGKGACDLLIDFFGIDQMIVGDAIVHEYIVQLILFNSFLFSIPADHTTRANGRTDVDMVWAWNKLVDRFIAANGPRMVTRGVTA